MLFSRLVEFFGKIEATRARNEKTEILAEIFAEAEPDEIDKLAYLALGGLRPAFDRLEFNLAEKMIVRAIANSVGQTVAQVEQRYSEIGDLGELVNELVSEDRAPSPQSVIEVYVALEQVAQLSGTGSQEKKVSQLANLLKTSEAVSCKYLVRIVAGKLRLGFSDKTVIDALSHLESGTKEFSQQLENAYQKRPDIGVLARLVKEKGIARAIEETTVTMGTPIVPALAQRLKTAKEMIEKMGKVYVEKKWDGTRVQIHFSRKSTQYSVHNTKLAQGSIFEEDEKPEFWVRTFTRNLDESSAMFPELQRIAEQIKADEVILDSEAVGYDPKTGKLVPFQLTITRKRKHGVSEAETSVPLRFFVFDIMYKDGESLIQFPLSKRREILAETINSASGPLVVDEYVETDDPDVLRKYHKTQLEKGLEGALVKQVDGAYMPGRTGFNWVKFKEAEDSRAKLSDTIDAVIMGYYLGKGKRSGFGLGAFLVGILDDRRMTPDSSEVKILTLAKVGTGITDSMFGELRERLEKIRTENKNIDYSVPKTLEPDVWVEPKIVVELAADEVTKSPTHTAGYALRFPRLVRIRDDKNVEQTTTLDEIKSMISI